MTEADKLLKEIMQYHYGNGRYNFSKYPDDERANYAFDAWCDIKERVEAYLKTVEPKKQKAA